MDFHVFTTHSRDGDDGTPLQLISAARLDYLLKLEAAATALAALVDKAPNISEQETSQPTRSAGIFAGT